MVSTVQTAFVHGLGNRLAFEEAPVRQPTENQPLVPIAAIGICPPDLHAVKGDWPVRPSAPFIPAQEGFGTVVATGRAMRDAKAGDRAGMSRLHTGVVTAHAGAPSGKSRAAPGGTLVTLAALAG